MHEHLHWCYVQGGSRHLLSVADSVHPLWRRAISCQVHVCTDETEDIRVASSGVCSDAWSRAGVCPRACNGRLREVTIAAFQKVLSSIAVSSCCWFHHSQGVLKCVNKLGLKEDYQNHDNIKDINRCILGLPLLPASDTPSAPCAKPP